MKTIPLLSLLTALFLIHTSSIPSGTAAKGSGQATMMISFTVVGTVEGYSYPSKLVVEIDGAVNTESTVKDQQQKNSVKVVVPAGSHHVRCALWAEYDGRWEERTIVNDYSLDFVYETDMNFKKKHKLNLTFDIDTSEVRVKK